MNRYWSPLVARLSPYVPGEQPKEPNLVKLNTNENPYGPSPRVLEAVRHELGDSLRLYPQPESDTLRATIAALHGLTPEHVFVGNGSDEVLAHAFLALFQKPHPVLFPDVTYSFYPVYCDLYGIRYERIPVTDALAIDPALYVRPNGGIVFANPNAPTGRPLALADVRRMLRASDEVVLVDEAYVDFGGESAARLVSEHENLLVVQTLSKSRSLAGLRVGFALGQPALIEALSRVKNSFNSYPLDRLASAAAVAALEDTQHFEETRRQVIESRRWLEHELRALGFDVLESAANFLFARHPAHAGGYLYGELRKRGVLVRHFDKPRIASYLRITVGTDADCRALCRALTEILSASAATASRS